jgi:tetratricopeptide (TPR) repeat protein
MTMNANERKKTFPIRNLLVVLLVGIVLIETALLAYQIPAVNERLAWRIAELQAEVRNVLFPHPDTLPTADPARMAMIQASLTAAKFNAYAQTPPATPAAGTAEAELPSVTPTDTPARPPIPEQLMLAFDLWVKQNWNNCAAANLTMMLNFWGWGGNQADAASVLKPYWDDKNVMPYELERYVLDYTGYGIAVRTGGTLDDLRRLIAAGFPVEIEKGFDVADRNLGWMGHYLFITGYDNAQGIVMTQDSYLGPNTPLDYESLLYDWRAFNFVYLVAYPWERQEEVLALLGPNADPEASQLATLNQAKAETETLEGQALAFAYFNLGSTHVARYEYIDAAYAFDMARYVGLPWRFLWYQTGPYFAYFYSGRYQDVIDLANETLNVQEHLEESWYWRGMARFQLGDRQGAIDDWRSALRWHPGFAPALEQLNALGEVA